jgi:hypothetical protein
MLAALLVPAAHSQTSKSRARKYPPIEAYLMPQASEIALTRVPPLQIFRTVLRSNS